MVINELTIENINVVLIKIQKSVDTVNKSLSSLEARVENLEKKLTPQTTSEEE